MSRSLVLLALVAVLVACTLAEDLSSHFEEGVVGDDTHGVRERRWPYGMWGMGMRRFRPWGMGYGMGMYGMGWPGMMGFGWGR